MDRIENTASNNFSFVAWLFVIAETCLPCRCLAVDVFSGSAIQDFIHYVAMLSPSPHNALLSFSPLLSIGQQVISIVSAINLNQSKLVEHIEMKLHF
jgi:hypothetical protein